MLSAFLLKLPQSEGRTRRRKDREVPFCGALHRKRTGDRKEANRQTEKKKKKKKKGGGCFPYLLPYAVVTEVGPQWQFRGFTVVNTGLGAVVQAEDEMVGRASHHRNPNLDPPLPSQKGQTR